MLKLRSITTTVTSYDADGDGTMEGDTHESVSGTHTYRYTYAE